MAVSSRPEIRNSSPRIARTQSTVIGNRREREGAACKPPSRTSRRTHTANHKQPKPGPRKDTQTPELNTHSLGSRLPVALSLKSQVRTFGISSFMCHESKILMSEARKNNFGREEQFLLKFSARHSPAQAIAEAGAELISGAIGSK